METAFAFFAAISLLLLHGVNSIEDIKCEDHSKVFEDDVTSEFCLLQRSALVRQHDTLQHIAHENSTSERRKANCTENSTSAVQRSNLMENFTSEGLKSQHMPKLNKTDQKSTHDLQMAAVGGKSAKPEKDGAKDQHLPQHHKQGDESKPSQVHGTGSEDQHRSTQHKLDKLHETGSKDPQFSTKHQLNNKSTQHPNRGSSKGHVSAAPKSNSKMNDQGPEDEITLSTSTVPPTEGEATAGAEGEAAPASEEALAPEGAAAAEFKPEDDPLKITSNEHFEEIALEIKEAKIVACVLIALMTVFVLTHLMHENDIHLLPEAVMVMMTGIVLGWVLKYYCKSRIMYDDEYRSEIAIQLLNEVFLPMLMLEAGWAVRRLDFISQLPYILIFAVGGTLISTCVIALLLHNAGAAGLIGLTTWRGCFCIASLISATDPVATLATYSDLKVDPLLNIIVFGEAAINDAVAIVIFTLVNDDYYMNAFETTGAMVVFGTLRGAATLAGSFLLGAGTSFVVCMVLRFVGMHRNKKLEILVVVLGGYLSYAFGEYFRVSGIICTLFNGMFMGKYAKFHLSAEGSLLTSFYISQMSTIMDAGVFLLSGVCCVCLSYIGKRLGLWLMVFCAVARVCSTVPCGLLSNFLKWNVNRHPSALEADLHILTPKYLFMIWHAGLRGGIAENLALQIGEWLNETEGPRAKEAVRGAVFMLVAAYVLIFGGTTKMFLTWLGMPMHQEYAEDSLSKTELVHVEGQFINWLHSKVFFPVLVGKSAQDQNLDLNADIGENDVLEVLHDVCHGHRGGLLGKKPPKAAHVVKGKKVFLNKASSRSQM